MKLLRALLIGLAAGVTPLLLIGIAVHFVIGIDQAIDAIHSGQLSYISAAAFLLIVCVLSGIKVATSVSVLKTAAQFNEK